MSSRHALRQAGLVYGATSIVTCALVWASRGRPSAEWASLAIAALFFWGSLRLAQADRRGVAHFGLSLGGWLEPPAQDSGASGLWHSLRASLGSGLKESGIALLVVTVIFPPFALFFPYWHPPQHAFHLRFPEAPWSLLASHLLLVALPEESLFRGYFQTRLSDVWPRQVRVLGVSTPLYAWLMQAFGFGLLHALVDLNPARLVVFFPGLLFGWLRAWRGGIGAAIVVHALSNFYAETLVRGWFG